jgi:hypothetical protein
MPTQRHFPMSGGAEVYLLFLSAFFVFLPRCKKTPNRLTFIDTSAYAIYGITHTTLAQGVTRS